MVQAVEVRNRRLLHVESVERVIGEFMAIDFGGGVGCSTISVLLYKTKSKTIESRALQKSSWKPSLVENR